LPSQGKQRSEVGQHLGKVQTTVPRAGCGAVAFWIEPDGVMR
jgi:hypothetical protein